MIPGLLHGCEIKSGRGLHGDKATITTRQRYELEEEGGRGTSVGCPLLLCAHSYSSHVSLMRLANLSSPRPCDRVFHGCGPNELDASHTYCMKIDNSESETASILA